MPEHPKPAKLIEGERIQLRARAIEQAQEMFDLIDRNRAHLAPWMPWEKRTLSLDDTLSYTQLSIGWWEDASNFDYAIYLKNSGKMIGSFGFPRINWDKKTCEIGYWIDHKHEGQGFVSEAVQLGEQIAADLGFHRLIITCDRLNKRSQSVPERLGYELEALQIDECFDHHGRLRDTLRFVKLVNPAIEGQYTENLPTDYSFKSCSEEEFWPLVQHHMRSVFEDNELIVRTADMLTADEKDKLKPLSESFKFPYMDYVVVLFQGQAVGWTWGYQDGRDSYYMVNSAILPEHRGRGLYSKLLDFTVRKLASKGYQRIWSRHNTTNNAIIIPKLKRGFVLTGTELSDNFGTLVHLAYFPSQTRQKILRFRSGTLRPDDELRKLFKL